MSSRFSPSDNKNIGDLLNAKGVTWGYFQRGFKPTATKPDGAAVCAATHNVGAILGGTGKSGPLPLGAKDDYIPHHEPFQYYPSRPTRTTCRRPRSTTIGHTDQANHQYDLTDFWAAADAGHLPAVSFLKAPGYQDGHAGYSDPLDEQQFIVERSTPAAARPTGSDTAIIVAYDDSDGWYDHASPTCQHPPTRQRRARPAPASAATQQPPPAATRAAAATGRGCRCW